MEASNSCASEEMAMRLRTRLIDSQMFDDGTTTDIYTITDENQVIGTKTVRRPATMSIVEIAYRLGDETFNSPDAFIAAYWKVHAVTP